MKPHAFLINGAAALAAVFFLHASSAHATTWLNETGLPGEADFANLQFPISLSLSPGQSTPSIFGQLYEAGMTESPGPNGSITAELGYGPANSDPRTNPNWSWFGASYNAQSGNNDEYVSSFIANTPGNYSYTFRYSLDGGSSYTLGDIDGAGSGAGLDFSTAQQGVLSVVPEPGVLSLALLGVVGITFARRWGKRSA